MNILNRFKNKLERDFITPIEQARKQKIFCIGLNKTGTTSLEREMIDLGYKVGNQMRGTRLLPEYKNRNFKPIIDLAKSAQFFQDAPFSYPYTFIALDQKFKGSKFILTVRESPEKWYKSITNFHSKLWGDGVNPPTAAQLKEAPGPWPEFRYQVHKTLFDLEDEKLYNKERLIEYYTIHNKMVQDYFSARKDDLLVLNMQEKDGYTKFCDFLNIEQTKDSFPWENKTDNITR